MDLCLVCHIGPVRRSEVIAFLHQNGNNVRLLHALRSSPGSVTHMAAALEPRLFGQILTPAFGTVRAEFLKVYSITVFTPKLSDNVVVIAGSVQNQMVMESASES